MLIVDANMRRRDAEVEMSTSILLRRVAAASIRFVDQLFGDPANYKARVPMHARRRVRPKEGIDYGTFSYHGPDDAGVSFYAVHDERKRGNPDAFISFEEQEESSATKRAYRLDAASLPPRLEIALQKFDALKFDHELTPVDDDKIGVTIADPSGRGHFEFFVFAGRLEDLKSKATLKIRRFILLKLKAVAALVRERACGTAAKRLQCVR